MKSIGTAIAALAAVTFCSIPANAVTMTYTDSAAYFAAAGPQSLQTFNSPISNTATSVTYPDLVVSCSGSSLCDSTTFGTSSSVVIDGLSIFFVSPSVVTFAFDSPITSFGIKIAGLGTLLPGSTTFSIADFKRLLCKPLFKLFWYDK